jgi:DNA-binding LytR/AlgR family response regulator
MKKISCLIIDDEELARNLLENYIDRIPYLEIVGKCTNPLEAMAILQNQSVDLLLLDIQMPELTGIEFLKVLPQKPLVIFTTAYKEYALEGYELDVVDYLLKPFRFDRFLKAISKAGTILKENNAVEPLLPVGDNIPPDEKAYLLVKSDFKVFRIFHQDILYVESMKEYVAYHTVRGRTLSLGSLKKLEVELPAKKFMRIHKSYLVAKDKVSALEGNQVHVGDVKLPVGSSYKVKVLRELF